MEDFTKLMEQMMEPYRRIEKMMAPMRKMQAQFSIPSRALQEAIEPTLNLQKRINKPFLKFQKSFEHINMIYESVPDFENPMQEFLVTFNEIGERLNEYTKNTPEYFLLIAQNGWYIDLESELNLPAKAANKFQDGNTKAANELLIKYYKENLDRIFEKLVNRHQNRKEILNQILDAYKSQNHSLLIPAVLTQVDGICFDFTKKKFFIKEKKKYLPEVTSVLEKSAGNFLYIFLTPLQNQTPIMVLEKNINDFPCKLNRHEILHGVNANYGTVMNSLKVISLLKYVSDLLTDLDNKTVSSANSQS